MLCGKTTAACPSAVGHTPIRVFKAGTDAHTIRNRSRGTIWRSFVDSRRMYSRDGTPLGAGDAPVQEVLRTGVPVVNRELALERPDHSRLHVLANITALRDSAGAITGAVNIFQEITELKRVQ